MTCHIRAHVIGNFVNERTLSCTNSTPPISVQKSISPYFLRKRVSLRISGVLSNFLGQALDVFARGPLWKSGLAYRHGTGHGIGMYLGVHEGNNIIFKHILSCLPFTNM